MAQEGITPAILPYTAEADAKGEVKELYDGIKAVMNQPFVPNFIRVMGGSPESISAVTNLMTNLLNKGKIEAPVKLLIFLAIASARNCQYCTSSQMVACKMVGVDQDKIDQVAAEAEKAAVEPQRLSQMIQFCVKCSLTPNEVTPADYEALFAVDVTRDMAVELVSTAAMFTYAIVLTDAMGIPVDDEYLAILGAG